MSKYFSVDEMKQTIISALPGHAILMDFICDARFFGNMVAKIKQNGKVHTSLKKTVTKVTVFFNNE